MTRVIGIGKVALGGFLLYAMIGPESGGIHATLIFLLYLWLLVSGLRDVVEPERVDAEAELAERRRETNEGGR